MDALEDRLQQDLKAAMLGGRADEVTTLRGLKAVILNAKVAAGSRDQAMPDAEIISLLSKETKKRQESADFYVQGGSQERADNELREKALIERYLPKQLSESEIQTMVNDVVNELGVTDPKAMGQVIGAVKQKTAGAADGSLIARLVKERLA